MTRSRVSAIVAAASITAAWVSVSSIGTEASPGQLIAHEWGTFTSVAGEDGRAVEWLPFDGPTDLPCFVERTLPTVPKNVLSARLRMETPVIYFYAPRSTTVDVDVRFAQGIVTEHFPVARVDSARVLQSGLMKPGHAGRATWSNVRIEPRGVQQFPKEPGENHYYAARQTEAAPLVVNGQRERFLFYRGVSGFELPIVATVDDEQGVTVHTGGHTIRGAVLFENRGGQVGHEVIETLTSETTFGLPVLDDDVTTLRSDLERLLVAQGLYPQEAAAMVETWRDSWFEEGVRLFYVIPQITVDAILPLTINPRPAELVRVFVGRLELVTPAMLSHVWERARRHDLPALEKYGRFLSPIGNQLLAREMGSADRLLVQSALQHASTLAARRAAACAR